jgi:hypothetical protein
MSGKNKTKLPAKLNKQMLGSIIGKFYGNEKKSSNLQNLNQIKNRYMGKESSLENLPKTYEED